MFQSKKSEPKQRRPIHIDFPWSLPFIPLLLLAGGLSIPVGWVMLARIRKERRRLEEEMSLQSRLILWEDVLSALQNGQGTLIREQLSGKESRLWWTSEDLYALAPHPIVDWFTMYEDTRFDPFLHWCHSRYLDLQRGRALIVHFVPMSKKQATKKWHELNGLQYPKVEVPAIEILKGRERRNGLR